jgi:Synergist-CTERM protein sorting domain-containing protein
VVTTASGASDDSPTGQVEILVPAGATIDSGIGTIMVHADQTPYGTVTGALLVVPGTDAVIGTDTDIEYVVPDGTTISPTTGVLTLEKAGTLILPGPNGVIDTLDEKTASRTAAINDDVIMDVPRGTNIQPINGVVKLPDGRAYNYDGTPYVEGEPGVTPSDSGGGSGGCGTGAFGAAAILTLTAAAYRRRKAA